MSLSPFDFINQINCGKQDLLREDPLNTKSYNPFLINRGLSYFYDTVLHANNMNCNTHIPKLWQNDYLLNSIPSKKRFSKWAKKEPEQESLELVKEYYKYSSQKAKLVLSLLTPEQLEMIKQKLYKGGTK